MTCPSDEALARFASGTALPGEAAQLAKHVDGCASCQALVTALLELSGDAGAKPEPFRAPLPAEPTEVLAGRYVVGELLHRGPRSVVFEAIDRVGLGGCVVKFPVAASGPDFVKLGRALQAVRATGLPRVLDVVAGVATPFWVLERIEGKPLGPLDAVKWTRVATDLIAVFSRLQTAGLVHGALDARRVRLVNGHATLLGFSLPREVDDDGLALLRLLSQLPVRGKSPELKAKIDALAESDAPGALAELKRSIAG